MINKERFCQLIHMHERSMYAFALSILKNPEDAADCVQETILKAYSRLDTLRDEGKFKPWIMTVIHRTGIELLRARRDTVGLEECGEIPDREKEDISVCVTLQDALSKLAEPYRTAICLFYFEDFSAKQIAKVTDATEAAVRTRLARARRMLAELLDKESLL